MLQERSQKLEEKCKTQYEAGEQIQALNQYLYKYNGVSDKSNFGLCAVISVQNLHSIFTF